MSCPHLKRDGSWSCFGPFGKSSRVVTPEQVLLRVLLRPHGSRLWFLFVFLVFGVLLAAPLSMWDLVFGGFF